LSTLFFFFFILFSPFLQPTRACRSPHTISCVSAPGSILFYSLFTEFCGTRKRPLVCHCERLYGAQQSVLLLVHLRTAGVTDRRIASLLAMTPLFTDI
ncbi:MAG: hypothetical protein IJT41_07695, partial [Clostridia bacterium]|nr:hypothetical protein [Clostridia bacterium]